MAAYIDSQQGFNLTGQGEPERVQAAYADSIFFPMLGVRPVAGRTFSAEQDKPGSAPVALITHRFWQSHFGSDPCGRRTYPHAGWQGLRAHRRSACDVRCIPPGRPRLPVGLYEDDLTGHLHHPFSAIARLKPGVTLAEAQAELATLNHQEELAFPDTHKNWGIAVQRLQDPSAAKMRVALLGLFGVVGLVL